jgi:hypothetical protein
MRKTEMQRKKGEEGDQRTRGEKQRCRGRRRE